jgi:hypothetical protein
MNIVSKYIRWLGWVLWYLPQPRPIEFSAELTRMCRLARPWWKFKPDGWHSEDGRWRDIYWSNSGHYVSTELLRVEVFRDHETREMTGLRIFDEQLACDPEKQNSHSVGFVEQPEHSYPQGGALLSLNQAKEESRCRICGEQIEGLADGAPKGWENKFGEQMYPVKIKLNFGNEFSHTECAEQFSAVTEL